MRNLGESAFAGTVFPHDGVDLSLVDGEVNAVENVNVGFDNLGPQVINLEEGSGGAGHADAVVDAAEGGFWGSSERINGGRRVGGKG